MENRILYKEFSAEAQGIVYWSLIQQVQQRGWDFRFVQDGTIVQQ